METILSKREQEFLKENAHKYSISYLQKKLKRSHLVIKRYLKDNNLKTKTEQNAVTWSKEEEAYLVKHLKRLSLRQISRDLGISIGRINNKIIKLGLSRPYENKHINVSKMLEPDYRNHTCGKYETCIMENINADTFTCKGCTKKELT